MASLQVYDAIRGRLDPGLGGAWSTTPLAWPNEDFTEPEASPAIPAPHWVAVRLTGTLYGQESIGAADQADNRWDEEGLVWLHIFAPVGAGERTLRQYAKQLADLFRGVTLLSGALEFMDASIGLGEPGDEAGRWWQVSVSIQWRRMDA